MTALPRRPINRRRKRMRHSKVWRPGIDRNVVSIVLVVAALSAAIAVEVVLWGPLP